MISESFVTKLSAELYSTELRNYDPQLGRFNGIDVLSENVTGLSPYHFGNNNPITFNDPTGAKFVPFDVLQNSDEEFDRMGEAYSGINFYSMPKITYFGTGGGGNYAREIEGGFEFGGDYAANFLHAFQSTFNNPDADGNYSLSFGQYKKDEIGIYGYLKG